MKWCAKTGDESGIQLVPEPSRECVKDNDSAPGATGSPCSMPGMDPCSCSCAIPGPTTSAVAASATIQLSKTYLRRASGV